MANGAGIGKEIKEDGFQAAFFTFTKPTRNIIRDEICSICFWGDATFAKKLIGERPFRIYEVNQITEYFAEKGIDAWTGEPINTK